MIIPTGTFTKLRDAIESVKDIDLDIREPAALLVAAFLAGETVRKRNPGKAEFLRGMLATVVELGFDSGFDEEVGSIEAFERDVINAGLFDTPPEGHA